MKSEQQELEEKINDLEKKLDRLDDEWDEYHAIASQLTVSKLSDPRYPFMSWELLHWQTKNERKNFRAVMTALQNRLQGKQTPLAEQMDIDFLPKEVLYASSKPSIDEVVDILKKAGREDDIGLVEIMRAVKLEFEVDTEFGVLAKFVLDGVRIANQANEANAVNEESAKATP